MRDQALAQKLDEIIRVEKSLTQELVRLTHVMEVTHHLEAGNKVGGGDDNEAKSKPQSKETRNRKVVKIKQSHQTKPIDSYLSDARRIFGWIVRIVGLAAAVLGIVSGYTALIPRIVVSQSQPLDVDDPFSTPFVVANDGSLPLMSLRFSCAMGDFTDAKGDHIIGNTKTYEGEIQTSDPPIEELSPGERATVPCAFPFKFPLPLATGDMAIVSHFRIGYTLFQAKVIRRFHTVKAADGHVYWFAQPIPESARK